jgi:hypothetical protein
VALSPGQSAQPHAAIRLTTRRFLLNTLRKVRIELAGGPPRILSWGTVVIPVTPGEHTIRCYYPANFLFRGGDASVKLTVSDGDVVDVEYTAPLAGVNPGTWRVGR